MPRGEASVRVRLRRSEIREVLETLHDRYNHPRFIAEDPISVPHRYIRREDIEIAGFLAATIAWGNRRSILQSASRMMERMGDSPFEFVMESSGIRVGRVPAAVHRTFNEADLAFFLGALRKIYLDHGGLEQVFQSAFLKHADAAAAIHEVRRLFLSVPHLPRSEKHLADPLAGASAKRINMFLRWMVRRDSRGVDFGLWKGIPMSMLSIPLDVHTGNTARRLGLLGRRSNDWKAVAELDRMLRKFDADDPVRFDYALFGIGVDPEWRLADMSA